MPIIAGMLLALVVLTTWGDMARADDATEAERLMQRLLAPVDRPLVLAVRPFDRHALGMDADTATRLHEELHSALVAVARRRGHEVVASGRLAEIWRTLQEEYRDDIDAWVRALRADVQIICRHLTGSARPGIELSCTASETRVARDLSSGRALFAAPAEQPQDLRLALARLASRLAEQMASPAKVADMVITDQRTGGRTDLMAMLERQLLPELRASLGAAARAAQGQVALTGDNARAPATRPIAAHGNAVVTDGHLRLSMALRSPERAMTALPLASASVLIDHSSLPADLLGTGQVGKRLTVEARALVSPRMTRGSARRAAYNLARARLVAQALGRNPPSIDVVREPAEAVGALAGALDAGLTLEERPEQIPSGKGEVAVRMSARVVQIGHGGAPQIDARLDGEVFRAMEAPLRIEVRARSSAYIGLFAWGADNRIVRILPDQRTGDHLDIARGDVRMLPPDGHPRLLAAPLPGNRADHEALLLVATGDPLDFTRLAPLAGQTVKGTMAKAVLPDQFFRRLSDLGPAGLSVRVLPYQVVR